MNTEYPINHSLKYFRTAPISDLSKPDAGRNFQAERPYRGHFKERHMTQISVHAPRQSSQFTGAVTAVFGLAIAAVAGFLAFAPFFAQITG
jgi:hypothetical protein